jgi:hypothetical protein
MVTREGDEAIDTVMQLNPTQCTVREESSVWDCDLRQHVGEDDQDSDLSQVFYMLLLYRKDPERIRFRFRTNIHGELDPNQVSELYIMTGEPGEQAVTSFIFIPIRNN